MTDYTPDDDITFHCGGLSFKFSEHARLKKERDELLAMLKQTLPYLNDIVNHEFRDMAISVIGADIELTKARELIERIES